MGGVGWGGKAVVEPSGGLRTHREEGETEGFHQQADGCERSGRAFCSLQT